MHYVKRSRLERVRQELLDNYRRVRCPYCKRPVKLGRKAHARCLGALGVRAYHKIGEEPEVRVEHLRQHAARVRSGLPQPRTKRRADWLYHRFGTKRGYGELKATSISADVIAEVERLHARGWGRPAILCRLNEERARAGAPPLTDHTVKKALKEIGARISVDPG